MSRFLPPSLNVKMSSSRPYVDLSGLKGRMAEALVESIFRRAEYKMTRFGRESDLRGMLRSGNDEDFSPDFLAMKEVVEAKENRAKRGMYQTFMIEVKYRADLARYLSMQQRERENGDLAKAKAKWPNLCVVFVTDYPAENRSCFQAVDLSLFEVGELFKTVDLHQMRRFKIFPHNVRQHEELAIKLFRLFSEVSAGF